MTEITGPDLDAVTDGVHASIPIMKAMGVRVVELRRGHVTAEIPLEPNINHIQTMYAGSLFTVAEMLGGAIGFATFDTSKYFPIVKDLQIRFRRTAGSAVRATTELTDSEIERISADAEATGKGEFVLEATLTDEAGETVATTVGTYQLMKF